MNTKQAYDEFKSLQNDLDRWSWIIKNQHRKDYVIFLDNDDTFVQFDNEDWYVSFDSYLGWSDGVQSLLTSLNIQHECV